MTRPQLDIFITPSIVAAGGGGVDYSFGGLLVYGYQEPFSDNMTYAGKQTTVGANIIPIRGIEADVALGGGKYYVVYVGPAGGVAASIYISHGNTFHLIGVTPVGIRVGGRTF